MEPFALSIPGYRLGVRSRMRGCRHHDMQSQSSRSPSPETDMETETKLSSTSRLPSETINPLSHSPDTLHQLTVAGLSPEDELPSRLYPGFPHRPLPGTSSSSRSKRRDKGMPKNNPIGFDSGVETDTLQQRRTRDKHDKEGSGTKNKEGSGKHSVRIRHLNTMTAIMHRCLRDGDMARAKRAFGLLVRTKDVDVRIDNLWAIGSEILMRDGEEPLSTPTMSSSAPSSQSNTAMSSLEEDAEMEDGREHEEEEEEEEETEEKRTIPPLPQRWGTAANFAQVKTYLETLIQQHPYDVHRPHFTSAVDFWPALFGIEVYNLDAEFQNALYHIYTEHGFPSSPSSSRVSSPDNQRDHDYEMDIDNNDEDGDGFGMGGRRRKRHSDQDDDHDDHYNHDHRDRHDATDALRAETQRGALEITARMDGILENAPYATHAELLRLRAHVALFIADLYLPSRLIERYKKQSRDTGDVGGGGGWRGGRRPMSFRDADRSLRMLVRAPEEHVALARRREEQERARALLRRVLEAKGRLEEWTMRFLDPEEEQEEQDEEQ